MTGSIKVHFESLSDPRIDTDNKRHDLLDIVVVTILASLSGAEGWKDIHLWMDSKQNWLKLFLRLPHGLPSVDTIRRVISRINPDKFQSCFFAWIQAVDDVTDEEVIAIDGKTLRHSFDRRSGKAALHMVSAWSTTNHMLLGQRVVDDKSNEITAIPKLLKMLELSGAVVTIDAMGCQREIAKQIIDQGGDYVLALKGIQQSMWELFESVLSEAKPSRSRRRNTTETNRSRIEERTYYQMKTPAELLEHHQWPGLKTIGMVVSMTNEKEKRAVKYACYLTSLPLGVK